MAMHANVEDRGIKGDITPLMAAASGGYVDIVKLLLVHGADVNAQSSTGRIYIYIYKSHTYVGSVCPCVPIYNRQLYLVLSIN